MPAKPAPPANGPAATPANATIRPALRARKRSVPVRYSPDVTATILDRLADGEALTAICKQPGMPAAKTVHRWLHSVSEFRAAYDLARRQSSEVWYGKLKALIDELAAGGMKYDTMQSKRAAVGAIQWLMSKLDAGKWGERMPATPVVAIQINSTLDLGQDSKPMLDGSHNIYRIEARPLPVPEPAADA